MPSRNKYYFKANSGGSTPAALPCTHPRVTRFSTASQTWRCWPQQPLVCYCLLQAGILCHSVLYQYWHKMDYHGLTLSWDKGPGVTDRSLLLTVSFRGGKCKLCLCRWDGFCWLAQRVVFQGKKVRKIRLKSNTASETWSTSLHGVTLTTATLAEQSFLPPKYHWSTPWASACTQLSSRQVQKQTQNFFALEEYFHLRLPSEELNKHANRVNIH